ncbi:hypothetical protein B7463_g5003, partial [Scytalidium lignicola]
MKATKIITLTLASLLATAVHGQIDPSNRSETRDITTDLADPTTDTMDPTILLNTVESNVVEDNDCYIYSNPRCGITYKVCVCENGWVYRHNPAGANEGCAPTGEFLFKGIPKLPGWKCSF